MTKATPHRDDSFRSPITGVPDEGLVMYPDVEFVPRGTGVRSLTPEGYDAAVDKIIPGARRTCTRKGSRPSALMGTSLTFYRGPKFHDELLEKARRATGLPCSKHEPVGGGWAALLRRAESGGFDGLRESRQRQVAGTASNITASSGIARVLSALPISAAARPARAIRKSLISPVRPSRRLPRRTRC